MKKLLLFVSLLVAAGVYSQSITVSSPNGGEIWDTGTVHTIQWTSQSVANVNIIFSSDGGVHWTNLATGLPSTGSYVWTISGATSAHCFVRIGDSSNGSTYDQSDTSFFIGPTITLVMPSDTTVCYGQSVQLLADAHLYADSAAAHPTLNYHWAPDTFISSTNVINPIVTPTYGNTTYTVTVDDGAGTSATGSVTVGGVSYPQIFLNVTHDTANINVIDTIYEHAGSVGPVLTWQWYINDSLISGEPIYLTYNSPTDFMMVAVNAWGCADTARKSIVGDCTGCVWPGDANYDGLADNNDLLPIGLAYDSIGNVRLNATIGWYAQGCADWNDTLADGTNFKHIDCNGDGVINANDTTAILLNFGLTHSRSGGAGARKSDVPTLQVTLSPDTVHAGDTMTATLLLGDAINQATNVYGLAFTVNYDKRIVDSSKTMVTVGNSWLGNANDKISIAKDFYKEGKVEMAITRIDHTPRSGGGPIGIITFVITTDNINGKDLSYYTTQSWISDVKMIDQFGNLLDVNEGGDTGVVAFIATGIIETKELAAQIRIFPNPAVDQLIIAGPATLDIQEVCITDVLGNVLVRTAEFFRQAALNISALSSGTYFVEVHCESGTIVKRVTIAR